MNKIKRKIIKIISGKTDEEIFIQSLRKQIDIGEHIKIWSPDSVIIDTQRPHMLHIGNYVKITDGVTILAHDYSRSVMIMSHGENIGEARQTWIGDNVFLGMKSIVLMGAHIGNNTIVGAGSVVSGQFPDNVVIAGNPAKVICSLDAYVSKRRSRTIGEAVEYVRLFMEKYGRLPAVSEMSNAFSWLYLPRSNTAFHEYPELFALNGIDTEQFKRDFLDSRPAFASFAEFLNYAQKTIENAQNAGGGQSV